MVSPHAVGWVSAPLETAAATVADAAALPRWFRLVDATRSAADLHDIGATIDAVLALRRPEVAQLRVNDVVRDAIHLAVRGTAGTRGTLHLSASAWHEGTAVELWADLEGPLLPRPATQRRQLVASLVALSDALTGDTAASIVADESHRGLRKHIRPRADVRVLPSS